MVACCTSGGSSFRFRLGECPRWLSVELVRTEEESTTWWFAAPRGSSSLGFAWVHGLDVVSWNQPDQMARLEIIINCVCLLTELSLRSNDGACCVFTDILGSFPQIMGY
jgi:hypothetical protein